MLTLTRILDTVDVAKSLYVVRIVIGCRINSQLIVHDVERAAVFLAAHGRIGLGFRLLGRFAGLTLLRPWWRVWLLQLFQFSLYEVEVEFRVLILRVQFQGALVFLDGIFPAFLFLRGVG